MALEVLRDLFFLIAGIFLLIKGSDFLVESGSVIAKIFKINELLFGLTFISISTSMPELLIGINSAISGNYGIAIGNIVGTNIFNMCVILGIICIFNPVKFLRETVRKDVYMSLITAIILLLILADTFGTGLTQNVISRTDGAILLIFFAIFIYYSLYNITEELHQKKIEKIEQKKNKEKGIETETPVKEYHLTLKDIDKIVKNIFLIILGLAMIFIGADFVVDGATNFALALNFSQTFIAILVIAIGTSLPEISTAIVAFKKGKGNIAIGNLIGSNMFNTLFVLGTSAVISPIILPQANILIDALVFILVCVVIAISTRTRFELSKKEGILLLAIYICYMFYVISRL